MSVVVAIASAVVAGAALALAIPAFVFVAEVMLSLLARRRPVPGRASASYVVLVPAHDEARGIGATLDSLIPAVDDRGRILVIADNCTDETASIARAHGVDVLERNDAARRGKGYALASGVASLAGAPPDVLVFVDADFRVDERAIGILVDTVAATDRPVQADYVLEANGATSSGAISRFAFLVRNRVRPLGLAAIGGPCGLFGTGMAMPYALFDSLPPAGSHLVEDMWLGVECALRRRAPMLAPAAKVTSEAASSDDATRTQRTRWEHGHLGVMWNDVPRLFAKPSRDGVLLGLDLLIPPLAMLVSLLASVLVVGLVLVALGGSKLAVVVAGVAFASVGVAVLAAWFEFGRGVLPARELLRIPAYLAWKLPIYLSFARKRESTWVRTDRS